MPLSLVERLLLKLRNTYEKSALTICLECFLEEGIENEGIRAHTIQNGWQLDRLQVNNHVIVPGKVLGTPPIAFVRKGRNEASIFRGYCAKHDQSVFSSIDLKREEELLVNQKNVALLSLRVTGLELHKKKTNVIFHNKVIHILEKKDKEGARDLLGLSDEEANRFVTSFDPEYLFNIAIGSEIGYQDMLKVYKSLKGSITNSSFHNIKFFERVINKPFLLSCASPTAPYNDFNGTALYDDIEETALHSIQHCLFVILIPFENKTKAVLTWHRKSSDFLGSIVKYLRDCSNSDFETAISKYIVTHIENIVFSPLWDEAGSATYKQNILNCFLQTTFDDKDFASLPDFNLFEPS